MKIKDGFVLRKIAGLDYLIPIGSNIAYFNGIISLNHTALYIWNNLREGINMSTMIDMFMREYNLSKEKAQEDIEHFMNQLRQAKLIED